MVINTFLISSTFLLCIFHLSPPPSSKDTPNSFKSLAMMSLSLHPPWSEVNVLPNGNYSIREMFNLQCVVSVQFYIICLTFSKTVTIVSHTVVVVSLLRVLVMEVDEREAQLIYYGIDLFTTNSKF